MRGPLAPMVSRVPFECTECDLSPRHKPSRKHCLEVILSVLYIEGYIQRKTMIGTLLARNPVLCSAKGRNRTLSTKNKKRRA